MNITMRAIDNMVTQSLYQKMNFTDCYSFQSTDPADYAQAVVLKNELQKV